jgi:hypothetical protein
MNESSYEYIAQGGKPTQSGFLEFIKSELYDKTHHTGVQGNVIVDMVGSSSNLEHITSFMSLCGVEAD